MIIALYAIRDIQTDTFAVPFSASTPGELDRMMLTAVESDSMLSKFPADYSVFRVGEYDTATGRMMPDDVPVMHASVQSYVSLAYTRRLRESRQVDFVEETPDE